jgi:hypothetical protein
MTKAAGIFAWLSGLGFGLPAIPAIRYFAAHGDVWTFMGFPTCGEGPFEEVGVSTSAPLLVAFLVVCIAEVVVGWLLWIGHRAGIALSFGMLPLSR